MPKLAPPTSEEENEILRPFTYHGIHFSRPHNGEVTADCPFCGAEGKLSVNVDTGQGRCFKCAEGSDKGGFNIHTFIRRLTEFSGANTTTSDYRSLVEDRKLLDAQVLVEWNVCRSITTNDWIVPGYNSEGVQTQLYRYVMVDGKRRLLPTPTLGHALFGVNLYDKRKPIVDLSEGPPDAWAWYEVLSQTKPDGNGGFVGTANRAASLLSQRNVLAVPGCETFFEHWLPLFAGKIVNLLFDNDHCRTNPKTGQSLAPGGLKGMYRVANMLAQASDPPKQINYLKWGDDSYMMHTADGDVELVGIDPERPSGHDLRDELTKGV